MLSSSAAMSLSRVRSDSSSISYCFFFARQAEHRVLRAALLLARDVQLILRGVQVALGLVRLAERGIELLR